MPLELTRTDRQMLAGERGDAASMAMRIVIRMAEMLGAGRLIDIASAHIDGCLYQGAAGLDFAGRLVAGGARVAVPTTLNVGALDLLHPGLYRGDPDTAARARRQMDLYAAMGCRPTWTCAPYQLPEARPRFGEHVAWAESNAIVFANSVLGARTDRYGDFIDICAAITGRAPYAGLHVDENRLARVLFRISGIPRRLLDEDVLYPVLGQLVGRRSGNLVPAIVGLPSTVSEDRLKALGAAAASSGSVALFHVLGVTPEAPTLEEAAGGVPALREIEVTPADLARIRDELTGTSSTGIDAVSLGTPHFSVTEFERLVPMLEGFHLHRDVALYVSTSRHVLREVESRGWLRSLDEAGVTLVTDTCTYIAPIIERGSVVMTNSAKWAWYAPGNIGVDVVFGSLEECLRSAALGRAWKDEELWGGV